MKRTSVNLAERTARRTIRVFADGMHSDAAGRHARLSAVLDLSACQLKRKSLTCDLRSRKPPRTAGSWGKIAAPHHRPVRHEQDHQAHGVAFIFWSRWLQAPLYLGLIVAQGVYVYQFMHELAHPGDQGRQPQRERGHADRAGPDRRGHDRQPADHGHHRRLRNLRLAARPRRPPRPAGMAVARQCRRAQGQAGGGPDQHFLDPPAAHLHQRRQPRTASSSPRSRSTCILPGLRHRHRLHRQDHDADPGPSATQPNTETDYGAAHDHHPPGRFHPVHRRRLPVHQLLPPARLHPGPGRAPTSANSRPRPRTPSPRS
jgi:hypothetical protein